MNPVIALLNSISPLSSALQEHMNDILEEKSFLKREYFLKAGHVCRNIYFITSGLVRCYYHKGDTEVCSWFMKEGDLMISVESFYSQTASYESIQAIEDCEVYSADYFDLQHLYKDFQEYNF